MNALTEGVLKRKEEAVTYFIKKLCGGYYDRIRTSDLDKQKCGDIRRLSLDEQDDRIKWIQEQVKRFTKKEPYESRYYSAKISTEIAKDSVTSKTGICIEKFSFLIIPLVFLGSYDYITPS